MATNRNDDKGYERGARGIDGRDGENFVKPRYPSAGASVPAGRVSGSDGGPDTKGRSALLASAKGK